VGASLPFLLGGLVNTLAIAGAASLVALALALAVGSGRYLGGSWLRVPLTAYVEIFRGTSLLLQLFWLFFVLPTFGVDLTAMTVAVLGIGLNYGAYGSEVVRGALAAVPRGQVESAVSLGLRPLAAFALVILPQALPVMIQPLGVLAIQLLKATSLASLITISDLSFRAYQLNQLTSRSMLIFGIVLALYFVCAQAIAAAVACADAAAGRWRRLAREGRA
jgi:polar amino acid transport system permease protein